MTQAFLFAAEAVAVQTAIGEKLKEGISWALKGKRFVLPSLGLVTSVITLRIILTPMAYRVFCANHNNRKNMFQRLRGSCGRVCNFMESTWLKHSEYQVLNRFIRWLIYFIIVAWAVRLCMTIRDFKYDFGDEDAEVITSELETMTSSLCNSIDHFENVTAPMLIENMTAAVVSVLNATALWDWRWTMADHMSSCFSSSSSSTSSSSDSNSSSTSNSLDDQRSDNNSSLSSDSLDDNQ